MTQGCRVEPRGGQEVEDSVALREEVFSPGDQADGGTSTAPTLPLALRGKCSELRKAEPRPRPDGTIWMWSLSSSP